MPKLNKLRATNREIRLMKEVKRLESEVTNLKSDLHILKQRNLIERIFRRHE